MRVIRFLTGGVMALALSSLAQAAMTAEQLAKRGSELTPIGANHDGNAEGTIPAWTGGLTQAPAGFKPGSGVYVDPFADEKPLYVITAANMAQYDKYLTDGTKALLKRFPDTYKVPVYPTHRTAAFPQQVYDDIKRDAEKVELTEDGLGIRNIGKGRIPFPIPKNGTEAIVNFTHRYFGDDILMNYNSFPVQTNGTFTPVKAQQTKVWAPAKFGDTEFGIKVYYEMFAPASNAGYKIVTHEPLNFAQTPRQTWAYNPGQRRVLRAPEISYDTPIAGSDGLITNDQTDCFNGARDRYDWNLVGKQEKIIPYNNYKLNAIGVNSSDMIGVQHVNPELMRYELHRVWVVDATLKQGKRNVFAKRRYYFDEDSWNCGGGDLYDGRGELWRVIVPSIIQMYDVPMTLWQTEAHYDLQARRYMVQYAPNKAWLVGDNAKEADFTISKLRRSGR